jgi:hypothetical protein
MLLLESVASKGRVGALSAITDLGTDHQSPITNH